MARTKQASEKSSRAKTFKAFTDEHRLRIIELLFEGGKTVGELAAALNLAQSLTSHHILALKDAGIVAAKKQGRSNQYFLPPSVTKNAARNVLNLGCCTVSLK